MSQSSEETGASRAQPESWRGKPAKEIMGGVRGVLGEDRFDVFRAHSGEYRRGEIDGSQVSPPLSILYTRTARARAGTHAHGEIEGSQVKASGRVCCSRRQGTSGWPGGGWQGGWSSERGGGSGRGV